MTIEEKKKEMVRRIKEMLDNYELTYDKDRKLFASYDSDRLLRNLSRGAVICISFMHPLFGHKHIVYADAETLELLYVQTGPVNFVDIDIYFSKETE